MGVFSMSNRPRVSIFNPAMGAKGFTLIELLVVIAIIAILAAILFPVFAQARDKARQASCLSNQKQLVLAAVAYTQDYDGSWPQTFIGAPTASAGSIWTVPLKSDSAADKALESTLWAWALQPYIKSIGVYVCPSVSEDTDLGAGITMDDAGGFRSSYLINGYLNTWPESMSPSPSSVIAFSEATGKQAMIGWQIAFPLPLTKAGGDMAIFNPGDGVDCNNAAGSFGFTDVSYAKSWQIHNSGQNYSYMDGHVKYQPTPGGSSAWAALDSKGIPATRYGASASTGWCNSWSYNYGPVITK
jgi:prepilin-type N-terminal cleavage/methylation domain-containing protein/prepilin-type processing-associated H-X9-DG protein